MIIDFTKKQLLQESWLKMLGSWSKSMLRYMYGDDVDIVANVNHPTLSSIVKEEDVEPAKKFVIRGKYGEVKAYAMALVKEKEYLDAYVDYGEDHPQTIKAKAFLDDAVKKFETATGLIWPFKDEG